MITLRPDQIDDVVRARDALGRNRRVLLYRPTGTGKTVWFCAISEVVQAGGARTLILQHREELFALTSRTLAAMDVAHGIIAAGHPIAATVQIASINTLTRRLAVYRPDEFQLVFVDEAHHAAAPSWERVIDHFAGGGAFVIGCSATPLRWDGRGLDDLFDELIVSRSVTDYVALGVLVPAVTYAPTTPPDLSVIRTRGGDYETEALAARMADSVITGDAIEQYRRLSPQLPGLVYCCSIAHSQRVCEVGRAFRTAPGKRRGLILDHAGNSLRHGLYDFEHEWSLQGRPKKSTEPLARQCPECVAVLPIRAETCPECGYCFVVQLQPPRIPKTAAGELARVDDVSGQYLRLLPYPQLLKWCQDDPIRLEQARRARGYAKGWKYHAALAWRDAQRRAPSEG
jgi:Type III restriction enzyme, res subunit